MAIDKTCVFCRDFAKNFSESSNRIGIQSLFSFDLESETPDISELERLIKIHELHFLLLPNYSKQSGFVISSLKTKFPHLKFVGSDGWGDGEFGYLTKFPLGNDQIGFSLRPGRPDANMRELLKVPGFNVAWQGMVIKPPFAVFALIELLQKVTEQLCTLRPKSREQFQTKILSKSATTFRSNAGMSVYLLRGKTLKYEYSLE